jgi:hypothetical protein
VTARLDRAWVVALVAAVGAVAFVAVRCADLGSAGAFVVAGDAIVDEDLSPDNVPVIDGPGFDGQYFWRQAMDPAALDTEPVRGIALDRPLRAARPGYPILAWLASGFGRPGLVPVALIGVNVAALAALAWIAARLVQRRGRHALWGLAIAGYWGFAVVVARDLSEIVTAAAVFGAALAIDARRWPLAAAAGVGAVLTREQALVSLAALAVGVVVAERRCGTWRGAVVAGAVVLAPAVVAVAAVQAAVWDATGELAVTEARQANSAAPLSALREAIPEWVRGFGDDLGSSLPLATAVVLAGLACWALPSARTAWRAAPWEVTAWVASLALVASLSANVLVRPTDHRQLFEVAGWSWLIALRGERRWPWAPLIVVVPVTAVVVAFRARTL